MAARLQHQPRGADQRLGGALHRHGTGEAAGHAAVRHGLDEEVHKGRSAAGHGAAGVHQMVVQGQQPPGACHVLQERRFLLRRDAVAGVEDHALPDGRGGIGHDADQGPVPAAPLPQVGDGEGRRHGHQHEPVLPRRQHGADLLHQPCHHIGLHAQEDVICLSGHRRIVHSPAVQLLGQGLRFGGGAVRQQDLSAGQPLAGRPGQGAAHISGADKTKCRHCASTSFFKSESDVQLRFFPQHHPVGPRAAPPRITSP